MKKIIFLFFLLLSSTLSLFSQLQVCPLSNNEWQWPTHTNWFFGKGKNVGFGASGSGASTVTALTGGAFWFPSYEAVSSVSDESGNLIFFTNGVELWDAGGNAVAIPGGKLKTGAEIPTGDAGSAVQGVFIVKHPLDQNNYYIFCTDDAIYGQNGTTNGFNYFVYNKASATVTGPTRLGNYRSTEQVAATWHSNGIDIWIVTHEALPIGQEKPAFTQKYNAYLLSCSGVNSTPVSSTLGFKVTVGRDWQNNLDRSNERSSLQFSWNSKKAAATHHRANGDISAFNETVSLMDFNNTTGVLSNSVPISINDSDHGNPYDCEFSPSSSRIYVTYQSSPWAPTQDGKIGYYNVAAPYAYTNIANLGINVDGASIKLGGDGKIYMASFTSSPWGYRDNLGAVSTPDGAASFNVSGKAVGSQVVGYGLPNMFVPPRDYLKVRDTTVKKCHTLNMAVTWKCKGTDAEDITVSHWSTVNPAHAAYITDTKTGAISPNTPVGTTIKVIYTICSISDTAEVTIVSCACPLDLKNEAPKVCVGNKIKMDTTVLMGPGIWSIDSLPTSVGTSPTLVISAGDTVFTTVAGNKIGTYKLLFKDATDAACRDSIYITVNPLPTPNITPFGPLCSDSTLTTMTLTPTIVGGTGQWYINNVNIGSSDKFDPTSPVFTGATITRTDTVKYTHTDVNGCVASDKEPVIVNKRKDATITAAGPYCMNDPKVQMKLPATSTSGGVWSGDIGTNYVNASGLFDPLKATPSGTKKVYYTLGGLCGDKKSIDVVVNDTTNARLTITDSTVCKTDAPVNLNAFTKQVGGTWKITAAPAGAAATIGATSSPFDPQNPAYVVGDYTLEYSFAGACPSKHTLVMHVVSQFDATISVPSSQDTICQNSSSFAINKVSNGGKFFATCGACINQTTGVFNPALAVPGVNTVSYGLQSNCGDTSTVDITVLPVFTSVITQDKTLCLNQAYTATNTWLPVDPLTLGYIVPGTWKIVGAGSGLNAATGTFDSSLPGIGTYKITYEVSAYACYVPDTVTINVIASPTATITGDSTVCENVAGVQLTANGAAGVWWEAQSKVNSTGFFNSMGTSVGVHLIEYRMDNGTCKDTVTYPVRVKKVPKTDFKVNKVIDCVWLDIIGTDISDSVPVISFWTFVNGAIYSGDIGTASYTYNTVGLHSMSLKNTYANGCISEENKVDYLTALPLPKADFTTSPDLMRVSNPSASFYDASSSDVTSWAWNFSAKGKPGTSVLSDEDVIFSSTDDDTIPVKLVVSNGYCLDSITRNVYVRSNTTIFVPNAFTPNNDGENDAFLPKGINFGDTGYEFMIFDRWGEVIFKTNNPTEAWNGKRSNDMRDAQVDVYVWRVTYVDHFSGIKQKPVVGHVALIR
ncbi:MAG: gliding motility-associated C-terminal domain-containing protein [Bacteroidetes bacterium]|nr:gliding motility-associated C-terminal domain-containing protein [Bacteroidota bacterium]